MLIIDVLHPMSRAQRALCAHRWGIEAGAPAMMAERALVPEVAERIFRGASEAGAPNLLRVLIEFGGAGFAIQPMLEAEASVLREWGLLAESEDAWHLPADLAAALQAKRQVERYFLVPLLARLDARAWRQIAEELSLPLAGTAVRQIALLAVEIVDYARAAKVSAQTLQAAEAVARLESAALPRLGKVSVVEGSAGQRFRITLDGANYEIAPREIAEIVGYRFRDVTVKAVQPSAFQIGRVSSFPVLDVSALLVFPSRESLLEAMRSPRFAALVLEMLGESRVLLRPGLRPDEVRHELLQIGFEGVLDAGLGGSNAGG